MPQTDDLDYSGLVRDAAAVRDQQLRASTSTALAFNPDEVAKRRQQARALGLPDAVGEAAPEDTKRAFALQQAETATRDSPALLRYLSEPEFAKVAHDDVGPLSAIEKGIRELMRPNDPNFKRGATATGKFLADGVKSLLSGAATLGSQEFSAAAMPFDWLGQIPFGGMDSFGRVAAEYRSRAQAAKAAADQFRNAQDYAGDPVASGLQSGMQSAGQNLLMLPAAVEMTVAKGVHAGAQLFAGLMGAGVGADAYTEAREKGLAPTGSLTYAVPQGVFEYAFESIPASKLLGDLASRVGLAKIVGHQLTSELWTEQLTTVAQDLNEWVRLNPEKTLKQFIAERPDAAVQTAVATLVGVGVQSGTIRAIQSSIGNVAGQEAKAQDAMGYAQRMQELLQLAGGSKLRERDPESFAAFAQDAAAEAGFDGNVHVEGTILAEALNQAGITPEQFAQLSPTAAEQLAQAAQTGGTVTIPVGDLASKMVGTGLEQALLPHLRMTEDALSQEEAVLVTQQAQQTLQQEATRLVQQAQDGAVVQASADVVKAQLLEQLTAANRFTKDVNDAYASLAAAFYTATAARFGVTPEEMYAKYPLRIQAVNGDNTALGQAKGFTSREIQVDGKWRPVEDATGQMIHPTFAGQANFWQWFGDSKAVGDHGRPVVFYHGTRGDFDTFGTGEPSYFTADPSYANIFAGGITGGTGRDAKLVPVYLNMRNPLDARSLGLNAINADQLQQFLADNGVAVPQQVIDSIRDYGPTEFWDHIRASNRAALLNAIRAAGYDGIIQEESVGDKATDAWVTFDANQIKSALGNDGTFDATDSSILSQGENNGRSDSSGRAGTGQAAPGQVQASERAAALPGAPVVAGATGPDLGIVTVAEQYARDHGLAVGRQAYYADVDPERAARIADAYAAMEHAPNDPRVREAYENLIRQTRAQYDALAAAGYRFHFIDIATEAGQQYAASPFNAMRDLRTNKAMGVFPTEEGFGTSDFDPSANPLLADTGLQWPMGPNGELKRVLANDLFRAVHDAFGHGMEGAGFRAQGEENAWQAHARLFTGSALGALTSETRGQNSWLNFGPYGETNRTAKVEDTVFADQKTGLMPEWTWTEGMVPDEATFAEQSQQRRMRQAVDLLILQRNEGGETSELSQSEGKPGQVAVTGVHFGRAARTQLDGRFYGTGLKGLERERVFNSPDQRLRERVYFYVDEGNGVRPEAGVGGAAHSVELPNLYDISADPLGLIVGGDINGTETNVLNAGFDGYYRRDAFNRQGAAVVIGPASHELQATPIQNPTTNAPVVLGERRVIRVNIPREIADVIPEQELQAVAPSFQLELDYSKWQRNRVTVDEREAAAIRPTLAALGVTLPVAPPMRQGTGSRGTFSPKSLTITLLEKADLSTFLHETGHFFLEAMADMASQPNAPAEIAADMQTVLDWFGIADAATWRGMTLDQQRPYHEKFAESFEQYLFEGKAPSKDMASLFSRFREWLTNVYRSLSQFMASYDTKLSDEVRGVFDRLIATQEQIEEANAIRGFMPMFEAIADSGMDMAQWEAYQATNAEAVEQAMAKLQARSLRDLKWVINARSRALKAIEGDAKEKRKAIEAEVRAEVQAEPVYAAQRWLKTGKMPDGTETTGAKLSMAALKEMYGDGPAAPWRYLATNMVSATADNSMHPDVVGEMFGFDSGDALVRAIVAAFPEDSEIAGRTDQRMLERYGDLATPEAQRRAADQAVHNEARARMVATELAALQASATQMEPTGKTDKKGRPIRTNVMTKAAKQFAERLIAARRIRDVKPNQHLAAETRAAKRALEAVAKGDTVAAATAKKDQLLNFYAAKESQAALDEIEKAVKYLRKVADSDTLEAGYREQIETILERFNLRPVSARQVQRNATLLEWVESQREMGVEPNIPPELLDEAQRKPYQELTVEEFRGLVSTVKQIEHFGRLKHKLLTAKDQREFGLVVASITKSIIDNAGGREADTRTPNTVLGEKLVKLQKFAAAHIKAATWARIMDGGKDGGPVWEYIIRAANEAGNKEVVMREQAAKDMAALVSPLLRTGEMGGKGITIPAIRRSLNREARIAVALNTGNASNMQRLMGGENWTQAQVDAITGTLTEQEWAFVQNVWDYFESFRPEIAAKEKRVSGVEPEWLEAVGRTVQTADGKTVQLRGGYYPVKYDPRASIRAEEHADADAARQQLKGAYTSATTRRSFTKTRAEEVHGRPLLYSLDGIYAGVNEVIHDLSWHEFLIDANRLIKNDSIAAAMRQKYGPEAHQQFKSWLRDIAAEQPADNEGFASFIRQGVSIAGLGFNFMSAVIQPLGITQSWVRIGTKWIGRGIAQYTSNPIAATDRVHEMSDFMRTRAMTRLRELAEVRAQVKGQGKVRQVVDAGAYYMMLQAQQIVDIPTWLGAYEKAIASGNEDQRARDLADQAVIDSQGSGTTKDQSLIERGGPYAKLFTTFYSFFNTALNVGVQQTYNEQSKAKLAAKYAMLYVVPVVLGALLKDALTAGDSGDWDDPKKIAKKLAREEISYLFGLMVGVREFAGAVQLATGTNEYNNDYAGPAGLRPIGDMVKLAKQAQQGQMDDGLRKAIINTVGELARLPSAQINRSITGAKALADGKTQNPLAILTGYQEPGK